MRAGGRASDLEKQWSGHCQPCAASTNETDRCRLSPAVVNNQAKIMMPTVADLSFVFSFGLVWIIPGRHFLSSSYLVRSLFLSFSLYCSVYNNVVKQISNPFQK